MSIKFDYAKLRGRIVEKCGTQAAFAKKVGLSTVAVTKKLRGQVAFRNDEILKMAEVLDISLDDLRDFFFAVAVR